MTLRGVGGPSTRACASLVLAACALAVFSTGFFQLRPATHGAPSADGAPLLDTVAGWRAELCAAGAAPFCGAHRHAIPGGEQPLSARPFARLVFAVVDALRADFAYDGVRFAGGLEYVRRLFAPCAEGAECPRGVPFVAMARAPTVTMPRLKALTAGTSPVFLDLVLNLDVVSDIDASESNSETTESNLEALSKSKSESRPKSGFEAEGGAAHPSARDVGNRMALDSWVAQLAAAGTPVLFHGDDTWMRVFPPPLLHAASTGVAGFFAMDTVAVDRAVERELPGALARGDWRALAVHFLGLDHVGHAAGGPRSALLVPKLAQMDRDVRILYEGACLGRPLSAADRRWLLERPDDYDATHPRHALRDDDLETERLFGGADIGDAQTESGDTLLVVLGDHGMTEGGNHGGATPDEVSTAAVFLSPAYAERTWSPSAVPTVQQVDIATTLALLLGLAVPASSTGRLVDAALPPSVPAALRLEAHALSLMHLQRLVAARTLAPSVRASLTALANDAFRRHVLCLSSEGPSGGDPGDMLGGCVAAYELAAQAASDVLTADDGIYDHGRMLLGIALAAAALAVALVAPRVAATLLLGVASAAAVLLRLDRTVPGAAAILALAVAVVLAHAIADALHRGVSPRNLIGQCAQTFMAADPSAALCAAALAAYPLTQFASSYIVEEHQLWHLVLATALLLRLLRVAAHASGRVLAAPLSVLPAAAALFADVLSNPQTHALVAAAACARVMAFWNAVGLVAPSGDALHTHVGAALGARAPAVMLAASALVLAGPRPTMLVLAALVVAHRLWAPDVHSARALLGLLAVRAVGAVRVRDGDAVQRVLGLYLVACHRLYNAPVLAAVFFLSRVLCTTECVDSSAVGTTTGKSICATGGTNCATQGTNCDTQGTNCDTGGTNCATGGINCATRDAIGATGVTIGVRKGTNIGSSAKRGKGGNVTKGTPVGAESTAEGLLVSQTTDRGHRSAACASLSGCANVVLAHAAFFAMGASHDVAAVDFAPAYTGMSTFRPAPVFAACLVLTWGPALLALVPLLRASANAASANVASANAASENAASANVASANAASENAAFGNVSVAPARCGLAVRVAAWRAAVLLAVLFSVAVQRHHLLVWTVFAPRVLFEAAWLLFYVLFVLFERISA